MDPSVKISVFDIEINSLKDLKKLADLNIPFMIGKNWVVIQPSPSDLKDALKENYYHTEKSKVCQICGVEFHHGRSNAHLCNKHRIFAICKQCGKLSEVFLNKLSGTANRNIVESIENNLPITHFCSKKEGEKACLQTFVTNLPQSKENSRKNCNLMNKREIYYCDICQKETKHNGYRICLECNPIYTTEYCNICGHNTTHKSGKCIICEGIGYHKEFCNMCNKETMHNGNICCECNPESNGQYGINGKINENSQLTTKEWREFSYKFNCNENCNFFNVCDEKIKKNNLRNKWGWCSQIVNNSNIKYIVKKCKKCDIETPHDQYNNCLCCSKEYIYCKIHKKWESIEKYKNEKVPKRIIYKICEKENFETPHKYNPETRKLECLHCSGEYVWCEYCQKWESKEYNSRPNHWLFWSSETKIWMSDNSELITKMQNTIINFNKLLNSTAIAGIYHWKINNKSIYIGESTDILIRSYNHIMYMFEDALYWYDIINHLDKNTIEIEILEEVNKNNFESKENLKEYLHERELYYINKLKPDSQKCDGKTDHIRNVNLRQFKINI